jgi:hypothetical protein
LHKLFAIRLLICAGISYNDISFKTL